MGTVLDKEDESLGVASSCLSTYPECQADHGPHGPTPTKKSSPTSNIRAYSWRRARAHVS